MADPEHLKILKDDVNVWNKWREYNRFIEPNLIRVNLFKANLKWANLSRANLSEANLGDADLIRANLKRVSAYKTNFSGADLSETNLREANLNSASLIEATLRRATLNSAKLGVANFSRADLGEADLRWAEINGTNLAGADLGGADLARAFFSQANLNKTDFSHAKIGYTTFADVDLSEIIGLESTEHFAPSTIGIDTIFRSRGKIPRIFLENTGVPDLFIEYMGSLTGQAFQFYSCFISHSTKDKEFADRVFADLRNEGVHCWFASEDMKGGKKIHLQLNEAIRLHDKLLLILSEYSINSKWVTNEIKWAVNRGQQEGRQKLFPVSLVQYEKLKEWELFDADTTTDLAAEVRSYFIPDFTNWKDHYSYRKAFKRLLRDLQADE